MFEKRYTQGKKSDQSGKIFLDTTTCKCYNMYMKNRMNISKYLAKVAQSSRTKFDVHTHTWWQDNKWWIAHPIWGIVAMLILGYGL